MTDAEKQDALGTVARRLMRAFDRGVLATTLAADGGTWPYASLVIVATDLDGSPLLLLSTLAEHTRNLVNGPQVSLLFDGTAGHDNPLTGPRLTLLGEMARTDDPRHRARFLARHPSAAMYVGFGDFSFYRITISRGHLVAGFGQIGWLEPSSLIADLGAAADLIAGEADIVAHMNEDHSDAVDLYATALLELPGTGWQMTGVDPLGADLRLGGEVGRVEFFAPIATPSDARRELVRLVTEARAKTARQ